MVRLLATTGPTRRPALPSPTPPRRHPSVSAVVSAVAARAPRLSSGVVGRGRQIVAEGTSAVLAPTLLHLSLAGPPPVTPQRSGVAAYCLLLGRGTAGAPRPSRANLASDRPQSKLTVPQINAAHRRAARQADRAPLLPRRDRQSAGQARTLLVHDSSTSASLGPLARDTRAGDAAPSLHGRQGGRAAGHNSGR